MPYSVQPRYPARSQLPHPPPQWRMQNMVYIARLSVRPAHSQREQQKIFYCRPISTPLFFPGIEERCYGPYPAFGMGPPAEIITEDGDRLASAIFGSSGSELRGSDVTSAVRV